MQWLSKNYPDEAARLEDLKKSDPELYMRKIAADVRRYGGVMEAQKRDPELGKILKQDLELKMKRNELLEAYKNTDDEKAREEIAKQLQSVVSQRFDVLIEKKQYRYKKLQERLEQLQKQLENGKAELDKWQQEKDAQVSTRVKDLLTEKDDQFHWD
jgi:hypothetical protein